MYLVAPIDRSVVVAKLRDGLRTDVLVSWYRSASTLLDIADMQTSVAATKRVARGF